MIENMIYNPCFYQLREYQLERIIEIIDNNKTARPGSTLFLGDSITQMYDINKFFPDIDNKYNCGICGFTSEALIWVIDEVCIKFKPSKVVLMIGTNDLGDTTMTSPKKVALNIQTIIDLIIRNLKNVEIVLISTLPCDENLHGYHLGTGLRSNELLQLIFRECKLLFKDYKNVTLVDVFYNFLDHSKNLRNELTTDGLHLNEYGYELYTSLIKAYIM